MKVKQLIKALSKFDENAEVILQKDAEGNGYSPLDIVDGFAVYVPDTTWSGDVYSAHWSADEACMNEKDWKRIMKKKRCVVLAPVN